MSDEMVISSNATTEFERTPPNDLIAEQGTLGSMLLSKDAVGEVAEILSGPDFYRPAHEIIFDVIIDLFARNEPSDPVLVAARLKRDGNLDKIGGAAYIHTLMASVPTAASAGYYAKIVREQAILRRLVQAGTRIVQLGYTTDGSEVENIINEAQSEIYAVTQQGKNEDYVPLKDALEEMVGEVEERSNSSEGLSGIPTGFEELDALTGGLHPGQMIIVAARPAMGKSTLALDFCRNAAIRHKKAACIFSLEMSRAELAMRLLSAESEIPLSTLRNANLDQKQWSRCWQVVGDIEKAPLWIDDSPNMSLTEIRAKARRLKQNNDLSLIVVDYLQLMSSGKRVESRQQEVSEFSRSLKLLAKELELPLVAVAQLNRGPETRNDKKPMLSDLRESGSLEQDADMVILLHREDYYSKNQEESKRQGEADLIVAKHRNGPTKTIAVAFKGATSKFTDLANDIAPAEQ